jgi:hypothetical protein
VVSRGNSGWWFALYIAYILKFNLKVAVIGFLSYIFIGILSVYFIWTWFYHDLSTSISFTYLATLALGGLVFVGHIFINIFLKYLLHRFKHQQQ